MTGPFLLTDNSSVRATDFAEQVSAVTARAASATAAAWQQLANRPVGRLPEMATLLEIVRSVDGGKYLRPRLAAASFLGLGGTDPDLIDTVGAALQNLHLGLCIHDDLIDGDDLRHGRFNVAATVRRSDLADGRAEPVARRQGTAVALLAGDLAVNLCQTGLLAAPTTDRIRLALTTETAAAIAETIAGEVLDVRSELYPLDAGIAITVAELKTAGYSMVLPLRLGAIAAGCTDSSVLEALTAIGRSLGIAYQLVDDDLGVFGDPSLTGKSVLSDLREGKRTEMVRLAWSLGDDQQREQLTAGIGRADLDHDGAEQLRQILLDTGARAATTRLVAEHTDALKALARQNLPSDLAGYLSRIADQCAGRNH